jgi:hypothetical protein
MTNHEMFYTARVACDSLGNKSIPSNAISVGTIDPVADSEARKRALDERERQLHELEHQLVEWDAALHDRRVRMDSAASARRDAIKHGLIADVLSKLDAFARRLDAYEEEKRANDPENQITLPPGIAADEGELQALKEPNHQYLEPNPEPVEPQPPDPPELVDDGDEGPGDLPNELTEKVPPIPGTEPELPGRPREPTARNPVGTNW